MGLKEMTPKQLKKSQDFLKMLEFFGVSEEDLHAINQLRAEVSHLKTEVSELQAEIEGFKKAKSNQEKQNTNPFASLNESVTEFLKPQQELRLNDE